MLPIHGWNVCLVRCEHFNLKQRLRRGGSVCPHEVAGARSDWRLLQPLEKWVERQPVCRVLGDGHQSMNRDLL